MPHGLLFYQSGRKGKKVGNSDKIGNRGLGVVRLSVGNINQTGDDTQRKRIEARCVADELDLIAFAEDIDVSASLSPWHRPKLGDWLNNRAHEFDRLVVYRLDRIVRSVRDLTDLLDWLDKHNKSLISIEEGFDFSTVWGRMVAKLLAVLAEAELEAIKARVKASREAMASQGRWPGGLVPFGRVAVPDEDGKGYTLEIDPEYGPILSEMIRRFLETQNFETVANWLNAEKVPTAQDVARIRASEGKNTRLPKDKAKKRGGVWASNTIQAILTNKSLLGYYTRADGTVVRNDDGSPVMRGVPVLSVEEFDALQEKIREVKYIRGASTVGPLKGVLYCECGRPMYCNKDRNRPRFRCTGQRSLNIKPCKGMVFHADQVLSDLERLFLRALRDVHMLEKTVRLDDSHAVEVAALDGQLQQLTAEFTAGRLSASEYASMTANTAAQREKVASVAPTAPQEVWTRTGATYGEWWAQTDVQTRREAFVRWGIKVTLGKDTMRVDFGDKLRETLREESGYDPNQAEKLSTRILWNPQEKATTAA